MTFYFMFGFIPQSYGIIALPFPFWSFEFVAYFPALSPSSPINDQSNLTFPISLAEKNSTKTASLHGMSARISRPRKCI